MNDTNNPYKNSFLQLFVANTALADARKKLAEYACDKEKWDQRDVDISEKLIEAQLIVCKLLEEENNKNKE